MNQNTITANWVRGTLTLEWNGKTTEIEIASNELSEALDYIARKTGCQIILLNGMFTH